MPSAGRCVVLLFGAPGSGKGTYATAIRRSLGFAHIAMGDAIRAEIHRESAMGRAFREFTNAGTLAPDTLVTRLLRDVLADHHRTAPMDQALVLEGYPRTKAQLPVLEDLLEDVLHIHRRQAKKGTNVALVLELQLRDDLLLRKSAGRLVCRGCGENYNTVFINEPENQIVMPPILPKVEGVCDFCGGRDLYRRADDAPAIVAQRLADYRAVSLPILQHFRDCGVLEAINVNAGALVCRDVIVDAVRRRVNSDRDRATAFGSAAPADHRPSAGPLAPAHGVCA